MWECVTMLFYGVGESIDSVVARIGGVETNIDPPIPNVNAFGLKPDGVEVDGVYLLSCSKADDVQPEVSGAVTIGQIGMAALDFAALRHGDTVDRDGAQHVGVGEMHFGCSRGRETELLEKHGAAFPPTISIEPVAVGIETPVLRHGETVAIVVDTLHNGGTRAGETSDVARLVAIAPRDVQQREVVAVGADG